MARAILCAAMLWVAGCVAAPEPAGMPVAPGPLGSVPQVVVGIVDTGINPYHDQFQDLGAQVPPFFFDVQSGEAPIALHLSKEGTFRERVQRDAAIWGSIEPGRLYWFVGTRILGMSLNDPAGRQPLLLDPYHGTAVASTIRQHTPQAWIVAIQRPSNLTVLANQAAFVKAGEGIAWLADQPWVDVLSISMGFEGNPPLPVWHDFMAATKRATEAGKPVFIPSTNLPTPTVLSGAAGPPWVTIVGGVETDSRGEVVPAGKMVDLVAEFTQWVAQEEVDTYEDVRGTSFSTPAVAGRVAEALLRLRAQEGDGGSVRDGILCSCRARNVTAADLRHALNQTAAYWTGTDYQPQAFLARPPLDLMGPTVPILPTPWVQMGWGYAGNDTIPRLVQALTGAAVPPKPAEASLYMAQQQAIRELYWSVAPFAAT